MNPAVGIDLGTTNTVVGVQTDNTGPVVFNVPQPVTFRNKREDAHNIKSCVFFESHNSAVVGSFASNILDAFRSIKSKMGTRTIWPHPFINREYLTPSYISAHILRTAYDALIKQYPDWDKSALITVPASFNTDQRQDTLDAAEMAGFKNVFLLDEPTAAFYYYFNQHREDIESQTVLVFDFGGGTLDVSIIKVSFDDKNINIDTIGRSRYNDLGGDDVDLDLTSFLLSCYEYSSGVCIEDLNPKLRKAIFHLFIEKSRAFKEEAEEYILEGIELNEFSIIEEISISGLDNFKIDFSRQLSRTQYEEITSRYLSNQNDINIYRPIGQALEVAKTIAPGFDKHKIDLVLYTGGSSRMHVVEAGLKDYFSPIPCFSLSREEACETVALGAASCRYDEMKINSKIVMKNRLLESILTLDNSRHSYITVIPLDTEPTEDFRRVDYEFITQRDLIKLNLPLFRGIGSHDYQISPMRDIVFILNRIIYNETPFSLFYKITISKTAILKIIFHTNEGDCECLSEIELLNKKATRRNVLGLCNVNEAGGI